jgi:hypothetical protein
MDEDYFFHIPLNRHIYNTKKAARMTALLLRTYTVTEHSMKYDAVYFSSFSRAALTASTYNIVFLLS